MDPKTIEMNNYRVLNDYLNQTLEVLARSPRAAHTSPMGYSPFTPYAGPIPAGTDVVWGQGPWGFSGTPFSGSPFLPGAPVYGPHPFTQGATWGALPPVDPFYAQRAFPQGSWPSWQQTPWGQSYQGHQGYQGYPQSFAPIPEVQRQALVSQALAAKHSVLEAICRAAGIPV